MAEQLQELTLVFRGLSDEDDEETPNEAPSEEQGADEGENDSALGDISEEEEGA